MRRRQHINYSEIQLKKQGWIWLLMIGINLIFVYGFVWQVILGNQFGDNPMSDAGLIVVGCLVLAITAVSLFSRLKTYINEEGIYVNQFPLTIKTSFYGWNDIEKAYVREYSPISEYGGYGIRYGAFSLKRKGAINPMKEKAYIVSGRYGLQLELKNGKRVLIGTQNPEEVRDIIGKISTINE